MPTRNISLTPELKVLRMQIEAGVNELDRGDLIEVDAQDLEAYLGRLASRATIRHIGAIRRK